MKKKDKVDALAIVAKLAAEERRFAEKPFLAPVVDGGRVRVRIAGVAHELTVREPFCGWAVLQMAEPGRATVIEEARPAIVSKYLSLFPRVRMIMLDRFNDCFWALAASTSDTRFKLDGPVPVQLVRSAERFHTVNTRFDGTCFWFESIDRRRDPAIVRTLSKSLNDNVHPDQLHCLNAVPQEKLAYKMLWLAANQDAELQPLDDRQRIVSALEHAGASLDSFWHRDQAETAVRLTVDGRAHTITVRTGDLGVVSAGICLSGQDDDFDLASLVGVLREYGQQEY